ncbi:hypothetical protein [Streptomyces griseofuscus]|uniref:hypothetical protein n=1 Tax=Streptomyces griseofuscus TaxID=146922 RepID=UPI0036BAEF55
MTGHQHVLAKDPLRLGWQCLAQGCRFFKPAGEFDGMRTLLAIWDEVPPLGVDDAERVGGGS